MILSNSMNIFNSGLILPFSTDSNTIEYLIVSIVVEEVQCFNTKKRVPYKIVLECVDYNEYKSSSSNK